MTTDQFPPSGAPDVPLALDRPRRIHIVGIGGAGMSAIAILLDALGHDVSGSDFKASRFTETLTARGIRVAVGHDATNVDAGMDAVAISSAVRESNPEVQAARSLGVPVLRRVEILSLLTRRWRTIAVAGTHGKTSTSSILATALVAAGMQPSYLIGGELNESGTNAAMGAGDLLVCEADESDGTFLRLGAYAAIVTNVEADHLENYGDLETLEAAFTRFLAEVPGPRIVGADDPGARRVAAGLDVISFGFGPDVNWRAVDVDLGRFGSSFRLIVDDADRGVVRIPAQGRHNVANALAALAAGAAVGAPLDGLVAGLGRYRGVGRRFDLRGEVAGVTLVDDYAHLPTEVAAAVDAARAGGWDRVVATFQPHLYSRTQNFADGFGQALAGADLVVVCDIFGAREDPVPGVTGELVAEAVRRHGAECVYVPHRAELARELATLLTAGDLLLTIGAGDITTLADEVLAEMTGRTDPYAAAAAELAAVLTVAPVPDAELAPLTTWRVGGRARLLVEPEDERELAAVAAVVSRLGLDTLVVGRGSNMLVSDAGFDGVAIRLGAGFNTIDVDTATATVTAGAATPLPFLARSVGRAGLAGLAFGVGIPASVGGAVRMNAGGHGSEIVEVLDAVGVIDLHAADPRIEERPAAALELSYRHSNLSAHELVVWARFGLERGDASALEAEMNDISRWRRENQPAGPSAGSTFTNPPGDSAGRLIDTAGLKGMRVGGAYVSPKHANFLMADPGASANDVFALIAQVRAKVAEAHGVDLVTEVRLVGRFPA